MRKKSKKTGNLRLAVIFGILVFLLILCSLIIKFFSVLSKSSFDGEHRFTVSVANNGLPSILVLSFAPDNNSISFLKVKGFNNQKSIGKFLKIPIDGSIKFRKQIDFLEKEDGVESILRNSLVNLNSIDTDLTFIDLIRLWYFVKTQPSHVIISKELEDLSKKGVNQEYAIDKLSSKLFSDYTVLSEKLTIQIVNGTNISGLGNRLARFISNNGGNVVSVLTSEKDLEKSQILYNGELFYTYKRLYKILGFPLEKSQSVVISDVIIIIGKDSKDSPIF